MNQSSNPGMKAGRPSRRREAAPSLSDLTTQPATVRVSLDLSREEYTRLKLYAVKTGQTVANVLRGMVRPQEEPSE